MRLTDFGITNARTMGPLQAACCCTLEEYLRRVGCSRLATVLALLQVGRCGVHHVGSGSSGAEVHMIYCTHLCNMPPSPYQSTDYGGSAAGVLLHYGCSPGAAVRLQLM